MPAKLGDLYRAYLLKINSTVSLWRTFGTVFIERILDLFAIAVLGLAAGLLVASAAGCRGEIQFVFAIGVVVVVILAVRAADVRNFGRRIITALPLPASRARALRPLRGGRLRRRRAARAAAPDRR